MTADSRAAESALAKMEGHLKQVAQNTEGMRQGFAAVVGGADPFDILKGSLKNFVGEIPTIGPALQAGLNIAESFINKVNETQKEIVKQGELAAAVGTDIEHFGGLMYAGAIDAETLAKAMAHVRRAAQEAANGSEEAKRALHELGLDENKVLAQRTDKTFLDLADAYGKGKAETMNLSAAQQIFGREFLKIIPMLRMGKTALQEYQAAAEASGQVNTGSQLFAARQAQLSAKLAETAWGHFWNDISQMTAGTQVELADRISNLFTGAGPGALSKQVYALVKAQTEAEKNAVASMKAAEGAAKLAAEQANIKKIVEESISPFDKLTDRLQSFADMTSKLPEAAQGGSAKMVADFVKQISGADTDAVLKEKLSDLEKLKQLTIEIFQERKDADGTIIRFQTHAPAISTDDYNKALRRLAGSQELLKQPGDDLIAKADLQAMIFKKGALTADEYGRALAKLADEAAKAAQQETYQAVPLLQSGSTGALSAIERARQTALGSSSDDRAVQAIGRLQAELQQIRENTRIARDIASKIGLMK